jgi:8-oxo-dGTP pyrophosphatase MutT (NUDIX family)
MAAIRELKEETGLVAGAVATCGNGHPLERIASFIAFVLLWMTLEAIRHVKAKLKSLVGLVGATVKERSTSDA